MAFLSASPTASVSWTDVTPPPTGSVMMGAIEGLAMSQDASFAAASDGSLFDVSYALGSWFSVDDGASSIAVADGIGIGPGINFPGIDPTLQLVTAASTGVYASLITSSAVANGLDPDTFARQLFRESGTVISGGVALFNPSATSPAGARGIAQFTLPTPSSLGPFNVLDPNQAIPKAAQYMAQLMADFSGNLGLALGAYNGGPGFMQSYLLGQVGATPETLAYVLAITGVSLPAWATPGYVLIAYDTLSGLIEMSGNAGRTWVPQRAPGVLAPASVAISGDGRHAVAATSDGKIWTWY